jgi:hypothetical protein
MLHLLDQTRHFLHIAALPLTVENQDSASAASGQLEKFARPSFGLHHDSSAITYIANTILEEK